MCTKRTCMDGDISYANKMLFLHNDSFDSQRLNLFSIVYFKFPEKTSCLHNIKYDKIILHNYT